MKDVKDHIDHDFSATCMINAPREEVFNAWTEAEQMKQWAAPHGFTVPFCELDLRVGGKFLSCMRSSDGKDYWSTGIYKEIVRPDKIVNSDSFSDENGNV